MRTQMSGRLKFTREPGLQRPAEPLLNMVECLLVHVCKKMTKANGRIKMIIKIVYLLVSFLGESGIHHVVGVYVNLPEKSHVHASFCSVIQ